MNCSRYLFFLICLLICLHSSSSTRAQSKAFKVYLVGDAGEDETTGETLQNLGKQLLDNPNSAVIFLGDNSYKNDLFGILPYGFKGFDSSELTQKKIRSQLNILKGYRGYVYFVPGNHDWWNLTKLDKGLRALKMEESFIEANLKEDSTIANPGSVFQPKNGHPGPVSVELDHGRVRLLLVDSYRLIITAFKKKEPGDFPIETIFYHRLDSLVKDAKRRHQKLIVAAHHPLYAKGPNSSPLKSPNVFGRIKASNSNFPAASRMSSRIRKVIRQYPGTYYVSGHVHSLQYFMPQDSVHYIVSGSGSKTSFVPQKNILKNKPGEGSEYLLWNVKGFFELDFMKDSEQIYLYFDNGTQKCAIQ